MLQEEVKKQIIPEPFDAQSYRLEATLFKDEFDTIPRFESLALGELIGVEHAIREKKGGRCFSPALYREGATRGNEGVEALSAIVFDFDEVTKAVYEAVFNRIQKMAHVIYSTHRHFEHGADDYRFRVLLPATRRFSVKEFYVIFPFLAQELGNLHDKSASDPCRIFYLPSCPAGRKEHAFIRYSTGILLDVNRALEMATSTPPRRLVSGQSKVRGAMPLVPLLALRNVFDECDAFGAIREKILKGEVLKHWEGFSLLFLCNLAKGGIDWFVKRVPGWGKLDRDLRQIERTMEKGYSPLSCKRLGEIGLCPYADRENPCLAEREPGKPRSPAAFLFGKKSIKNVRERNRARFQGAENGAQ